MKAPKEQTFTGKAKISFNVPEKLLADMDIERGLTKQNRSDWISLAIMEKLSRAKTKRNNDEQI